MESRAMAMIATASGTAYSGIYLGGMGGMGLATLGLSAGTAGLG